LRDIKYLRSKRVGGELLKRMKTSTVQKDITTVEYVLGPPSSALSSKGLQEANTTQI